MRRFLVVYGLFLIFVLVTYRGWGISWDEEFYKDSGKFYLSNFWAPWGMIAEKIPEYHALSHGAVIDVLYYLPLKWWGKEDRFEDLHLTKGLVGSVTLVMVYLSLREMMGKKSWGPVVGMMLLATYPRWGGDVFDNFMDGSAALIYALEIWLAVKAVMSKGGRWWLALAVSGAIGFSHRVALVIVPLLATVVLARQWGKKGWPKLGVMALVFYGGLWLVDPYIRTHGLVGIDRKVSMSADYFVYRGAQLFEGKYIFAKNLPWYYLPKWVGITTPLGTLILGAVGLGVMKKWQRVVLGGAILVPIAGAMLLRPVLYDGWRVFLFLSVPLAMIAAWGWEWLWQRGKLVYRYLALGLLVATISLSVKAMVELHPYEYVYFNQLVGGLKGASGQYETDYWGKTNREAVLWFRSNVAVEPQARYRVKTCATKHSATYFFDANMVWVPSLTEADYFICFTKHDEHKAVTDENTLYVVRRQGVPLNYIKKVERISK
ncbi:MAG: glycosyltransferase family 39 protein [Candidatus Chisholmbacteria bacterium]|nr:glycosyltransferase family 39 protein [Candidatus Chisholmbacteria bacterium]